MDKDYFLNSGITPPLQFEHTMATWNSLSSAQEFHCSSEQPMDCFMNLNWDKSTDQYNHFDSGLSSMVSSPVATSSAVANDSFALRELIGKLGTIGNSNEITPPFQAVTAATSPYMGNNSTSSSCFTTPLNSPPKLSMPMMDQTINENVPNMRNLVPLSPALPAIPVVDPGFAERAAKFSCFGSRSFNGRTSQFGVNNPELSNRSNAPLGRLPRVSSSPSLKQARSPVENKNSSQPQMEIRLNNDFVSGSDRNFSKLSGSGANSNEESSVSEQVPNGETGSKAPGELNFRKRKAVSRGKAKEDALNQAAEAHKDAEADDNGYTKRSKPREGNGSENNGAKEEEAKSNAGDESQKQEKANQKPPEPPKDYIHVRARRGQATDSHSLAERVRREKIGERMKLLQDLVPGCNKVTGKALMLDEIINYVQAMQRQVEFLSMKLSSVNPRMDFDLNNLMSKDMFQPNGSLPLPICPLDSSAAAFYGHQPQQTPQLHTNTSNGSVSQHPVDPLDITLCRNLGMQLPSVNGFGEGLPQLPGLCENDLQSIVQMGFHQSPNQEMTFHSQGFPATIQTSDMKVEL